jgi:16S rRNA (guanine966-N2)-methyltransferase
VRPSADRVRESLFTRLGDLRGVGALDLYAGTGALGIESLSRGVASVVFVERAPRSLAILTRNLAALDLTQRSRILREDVSRGLRRLGREGLRFGLVLVDPPYGSEEGERALHALVESGVLAPQGTVVVERSRRHPLPTIAGLERIDERRYGDTVIDRFSAPLPDAESGLGARAAPPEAPGGTNAE